MYVSGGKPEEPLSVEVKGKHAEAVLTVCRNTAVIRNIDSCQIPGMVNGVKFIQRSTLAQ